MESASVGAALPTGWDRPDRVDVGSGGGRVAKGSNGSGRLTPDAAEVVEGGAEVVSLGDDEDAI